MENTRHQDTIQKQITVFKYKHYMDKGETAFKGIVHLKIEIHWVSILWRCKLSSQILFFNLTCCELS